MCFSLALSTVIFESLYILLFSKKCMEKEGYFPICKIRKLEAQEG